MLRGSGERFVRPLAMPRPVLKCFSTDGIECRFRGRRRMANPHKWSGQAHSDDVRHPARDPR